MQMGEPGTTIPWDVRFLLTYLTVIQSAASGQLWVQRVMSAIVQYDEKTG